LALSFKDTFLFTPGTDGDRDLPAGAQVAC
jgi:hypothetical protein